MKRRVKDFFAGIATATAIEVILTDAVSDLGLDPVQKIAASVVALFFIYLLFFHEKG